MIKKSKLLSLLTAASIVLTSAGTYAAWDSLSANTSSNQVTFREPITVEATKKTNYDFSVNDNELLGSKDLLATSTVSFTVKNKGNLAKQLKLTPSVVEGSSATIDDIEIDIKVGGKSIKQKDGTFADAGVAESEDYNPEYTIEVTPKATASGKSATIKLTAELSATALTVGDA